MDAAMAAVSQIPAKVAIPAGTALAAYANAKYGIVSDITGVLRSLSYQISMKRLEKTDRVNIFYQLEKWAKDSKSAGRPFLILPTDPEQPRRQTAWTYAEAYETILKYAAWLKEKHLVQKGEIIAMDFTNKAQFIWLWFAIWSLGAVPAFINSNLREDAFIHCVKISTSRLLIVDEAISEVLTDKAQHALEPDEKGRAVESVIFDGVVEQEIIASTPYRAPDEARSGATIASPAILIYTSGTTGLPKAANVNWAKPLSGVLLFSAIVGLKPEDRWFTAMPLYHSSASVLGLCQVLGTGSTFVLAPKFSPRTFMQQVAETDATVIQYIGEACRYLVSSPPSPYDKAHKATRAFGNGMRPDVWQRFKDRFNISTVTEFYAATEGPGASLVQSKNDFLRGAIGKQGVIVRNLLQNNVLVRHDHETDMPWRHPTTNFCARCKTNEPGELLHPLDPATISEKYVGYYGNSKASDSKILRDVFKKGDVYYRTGDLQRQDADGRVWFLDRIGDTFRWKSENVSTAEVSEALGSHPKVKEANVYGVALPHHDGRAGCVALTLAGADEGGVQQKLDSNTAKELAAHARRRLPRYAVPIFLRLVKEVEVTGTMKHQKVALRNQGVDPAQTGEDEMFWLPDGKAEAYVRFTREDYKRMEGGGVKL